MAGYLISFKKIWEGWGGGGGRIVIVYQNWVFDFVWISIVSLNNRYDNRIDNRKGPVFVVCSCS
jgi:hypothetical protein